MHRGKPGKKIKKFKFSPLKISKYLQMVTYLPAYTKATRNKIEMNISCQRRLEEIPVYIRLKKKEPKNVFSCHL